MEDKVRIQVQFTRVTDDGISFTDSLYFTQDEYTKLDPKDLEAQKQARFDNWQEIIKNPPVVEEVPIEDQISSIDDQITALTSQKEQLTSQKAQLEVEAVASIKEK